MEMKQPHNLVSKRSSLSKFEKKTIFFGLVSAIVRTKRRMMIFSGSYILIVIQKMNFLALQLLIWRNQELEGSGVLSSTWQVMAMVVGMTIFKTVFWHCLFDVGFLIVPEIVGHQFSIRVPVEFVWLYLSSDLYEPCTLSFPWKIPNLKPFFHFLSQIQCAQPFHWKSPNPRSLIVALKKGGKGGGPQTTFPHSSNDLR